MGGGKGVRGRKGLRLGEGRGKIVRGSTVGWGGGQLVRRTLGGLDKLREQLTPPSDLNSSCHEGS